MEIPPLKVCFSRKDREDILARVDDALTRGYVAMGRYVEEFEEQFADYVGARNAVAVSSGSSAIEIAMRILGVEGKEVLVPTNTFLATAAGVVLAGGRIRLVDISPDTFSLSLDGLKERVTAETSGVIIVHIGGIISPEIEAIRRWCDAKGLWLFEDAAHAHGSEFNGRRAGTFGLAGGYSFFATKTMTSGEGGMAITDDDELAKQVRLMRNHGKPEPWVSYHTHWGSNWRMTEFAAAVGITQLARLDEFISWRHGVAEQYTKLLQDIPDLKLVQPEDRSSWYKYVVLLPPGLNSEGLKAKMKKRGVSLAGGVYEVPLHRQPVLEGQISSSFPVADDVCNRHVCLPLYYGMTPEEVSYVVEVFRDELLHEPA